MNCLLQWANDLSKWKWNFSKHINEISEIQYELHTTGITISQYITFLSQLLCILNLISFWRLYVNVEMLYIKILGSFTAIKACKHVHIL